MQAGRQSRNIKIVIHTTADGVLRVSIGFFPDFSTTCTTNTHIHTYMKKICKAQKNKKVTMRRRIGCVGYESKLFKLTFAIANLSDLSSMGPRL